MLHRGHGLHYMLLPREIGSRCRLSSLADNWLQGTHGSRHILVAFSIDSGSEEQSNVTQDSIFANKRVSHTISNADGRFLVKTATPARGKKR